MPEREPKEERDEKLHAEQVAYLDRLRSPGTGDEYKPPLAVLVTVRATQDIPLAGERFALFTVEGEKGVSWDVCMLRGAAAVGERRLFLSFDIIAPDVARFQNREVCSFKRHRMDVGDGTVAIRTLLIPRRSVYRLNPGMLFPLADFPEVAQLPPGTVVAERLGLISAEELKRRREQTLQQARELKAIRKAENAERQRQMQALATERLRERMRRAKEQEATADGRKCLFGPSAPEFVFSTELDHLEEHPEYFETLKDVRFEVTEKEFGVNLSVYCQRVNRRTNPLHICLAGREVKCLSDNFYWRLIARYGIDAALLETGRNLLLEGVVVAPDIRDGYDDGYRIPVFKVYDVFDIDASKVFSASERRLFCKAFEIPTVHPVAFDCPVFQTCRNADELQEFVSERYTPRGKPRHGLVFRNDAEEVWFDVVNRNYASFHEACNR